MNTRKSGKTACRLTCAMALASLALPTARAQWVTSHDALFQGALQQPAQGQTVTDPHFGTSIRRISNARAARQPGVMPQYAKRQAWNANDSLLLLIAGDGRTMLYDARTYAFLRELPVGGEDVFWHPTRSNIIISTEDATIFSYDVATDLLTVVMTFPEFTFVNTRGEGNLSRDGRWYAFVGQTYDGDVHFKEIVVCDLASRTVTARMALPDTLQDFDWVSISPLGGRIVVDYANTNSGRFNGVEVYDRDFRLLWQKPLGYGHSDLAVDEDGAEQLVMGYYDDATNISSVRAWALADGREKTLVEHDWSIYTHISCRNELRPGWCFVSTYDGEGRLTDDSASWLPFEDEIFAVRLDGSGAVQRVAHHRSKRFTPSTPDSDNSVYYAEPHATSNAAGTRVLFGSNWRTRVASDSSVDAYIVDFGSLLDIDAPPVPVAGVLQIWPNPVSAGAGTVTLMPGEPLAADATVTVADLLGRTVVTRHIPQGATARFVQLPVSELVPGRYIVSFLIAGRVFRASMVVLP
ncbi:MAG: T9SS type A sorting domain-containing protein [Ignavibacteria bacterium]|nr:T9SS type A sorting domain-containing protein [Ignavibacteria bacterium]